MTDGSFLKGVFGYFLHMFSTAGGLSSIIIFASMICAPFAGHLADRIGRRASLMIVGSLILIPSHLIMGLTNVYPTLPMIALGAALVLVPAAMWPSVPLIVKKERTGTAFGLITMVQNVGLAVFPAVPWRIDSAVSAAETAGVAARTSRSFSPRGSTAPSVGGVRISYRTSTRPRA